VADGAPTLHECHGCGLQQFIAPLAPHTRARCARCGTTLRARRRNTIEHALALALAALVLLGVTATATLMKVQAGGITHLADLVAGPEELARRGMFSLAVAVLFTSLIAPGAKLLGTIYALGLLQTPHPPRHIRRVFLFVRRLTPWSMIEVLLLGAFVAYVKLQALVTITAGTALISLMVLAFTMFWLDSELDAQDVWEEMARKGLADFVPAPGPGALACHACGLVTSPRDPARPRCPRCGSALHRRKPNSIARTWALLLTAAIFYIPANVLPVMKVISLGKTQSDTIMSGVVYFVQSGSWELALLIFFASIVVPVLKIIVLSYLLLSVQRRSHWRPEERTRLYRITEVVGRWSMVDIYVVTLMVALVELGALATIEAGPGAVFFAAVVVTTMFAAMSFDPRLIWDAMEPTHD
jgi:paraquat-inducible protein A